MAITPDQVTEAVVKAIPGFFNDAIDQFRDGEAVYIRDGEPEGIVAQIGQAVARSACRRYAAAGPGAVGSRGERFERACRPYLDSIDPGNGPKFERPFVGLQCPGVRYRYFYRVVSEAGVPGPRNDITCAANRFGPITLRRVDVPPRGVEWYLSSADVNGLRSETLIAASNARVTIDLQTLGRCDGNQDLCGNPPPIVIPPDPQPDPQPPPFVFNPSPEIDIDVDVDLNPDGSITVDIGTGPITVDPFDDGGDPGGGGGGDPGDPTDPGSPGDSGDTGSGGEEEGSADEGEELVGLLVEVLDAPSNANRFENNQAQPFRGIGYVRMGYPGRLGLDISGGTVINPQFFHAPQRGLTNWEVNANVGFNLRVTPYYRTLEE